MDIRNSTIGGSEGSEKHSRQNLNCLRVHLDHHHQTVNRNTDTKGAAGEDSKGNGSLLLKTGGKGGPGKLHQGKWVVTFVGLTGTLGGGFPKPGDLPPSRAQ